MFKAQIKQLLDYNIQKAIIKQQSGEYSGYYPEMMYQVLTFLRDILVEQGVRMYKHELKNFDAVSWYKNKSFYNLSTAMDEYKLRESIILLKEKTI